MTEELLRARTHVRNLQSLRVGLPDEGAVEIIEERFIALGQSFGVAPLHDGEAMREHFVTIENRHGTRAERGVDSEDLHDCIVSLKSAGLVEGQARAARK